MFERIKLKRGDVLVIETTSSLPEEVIAKVSESIKKVFPDNEVFFPNGAKVSIIEVE